LLIAFEGWNDATEGATGALKAIAEQISAQTLDAVDPEDYYDFQFSRPMVEVDADGVRTISWPGTEFMQASVEKIEEHQSLERLYLLIGTEPSRRWLSFAAEVLEMVQDREIDTVIMLGSMLADVPHTRPMPVFKSSQNAHFQERFELEPSRYEGPVGILSILAQTFEAEGIPVLSLWGSVPHYVHNTSNPKAALGFLNELQSLIGFTFDTTKLAEQAFEWERSIDDVAEGDEEMTTYVSQLEKSRDELDSEQASGDALAREFEKYLKERREGAGEG
jgi:proteasome assembly chaperone (PAC2) family protein